MGSPFPLTFDHAAPATHHWCGQQGGNFYESTVEDYGYNLAFSFTPVRADGVQGQPVFAKETGVVLPPPPVVHEVVITVRPLRLVSPVSLLILAL